MSERPLVLLLFSTNGEYEKSVFGEGVDLFICPDIPSFDEFQQWERVIAIVTSHLPTLSRSILKECSKLRLVARLGIGIDNIDLDAASEMGICVCNVPDYGVEEVADTAFAHILSLFRQTTFLHIAIKEGETFSTQQQLFDKAKASRRLRGKTLGLLGMGNIGMAVCLRAKAFGFNILVFDPYLRGGMEKAIGGLTHTDSVEELIQKSDCVSIHCPLTMETTNIINEDRLRLFKKDAFLVNTSRGGQIDEKALVNALKEGRLAGAALDVNEEEPFTYKGSIFEGVQNIVLTPHSGWYSKESFEEVHTAVIDAVQYCLTHSDPKGIKNLLNGTISTSEGCKARWN